jgi:chemotaxis protein MotB
MGRREGETMANPTHELDASDSVGVRPGKLPRQRGSSWAARFALLSVVALAAAGGAGWYAWTLFGQLDETEDELAERRTQAVSCEEERASLRGRADLQASELAVCRADAARLSGERSADEVALAALQADHSATKEELETLRAQRAEADKQLGALRDLENKLRQMIDGGKVTVRQKSGRLIVDLPAEVLFPSGKAELSRPGELALMELGVVLKKMPDRSFLVVGHTDNVDATGTAFRDNWQLSTARAVTVTQFLVSVGMKPENLMAAGHGEHDPVASNKTADGRARNRRIEVILMPDIGVLPLPGK